MAMVVTDPRIKNKEALDEFITMVRNVNTMEKKKVADGGLFINRVVLSRKLADQPDIKEAVQNDGRTYYDRYEEKEVGKKPTEWNTNALVIDNHLEVMCQCSNFHYTSHKDWMLNNVLNTTLKEYLTNRALKEMVITEEECTQHNGEIFIFYGTSNMVMFKLVCITEKLEHWLRCTVKDQPMTQQDSIANITFKSPFHQPMGEDWADHMKRLCITDYPHQLPVNQPGQVAPCAVDRQVPTQTQPATPRMPPDGASADGAAASSCGGDSNWQFTG
jgi:hypothetical protein